MGEFMTLDSSHVLADTATLVAVRAKATNKLGMIASPSRKQEVT